MLKLQQQYVQWTCWIWIMWSGVTSPGLFVTATCGWDPDNHDTKSNKGLQPYCDDYHNTRPLTSEQLQQTYTSKTSSKGYVGSWTPHTYLQSHEGLQIIRRLGPECKNKRSGGRYYSVCHSGGKPHKNPQTLRLTGRGHNSCLPEHQKVSFHQQGLRDEGDIITRITHLA